MARITEDGGEALRLESLVAALRAIGPANQALPGDRYCLQPPIFRGNCDVEQLIREFKDITTISEWPAPIRLLQLRLCLTGPAKNMSYWTS